MKLLKRLAVLFYVTMMLFLSSFILLFVLNFIEVRGVLSFLSIIYVDETLRILFAIISGVLLLINFIFYRTFTVNIRQGRTIAFDNPSGR